MANIGHLPPKAEMQLDDRSTSLYCFAEESCLCRRCNQEKGQDFQYYLSHNYCKKGIKVRPLTFIFGTEE